MLSFWSQAPATGFTSIIVWKCFVKCLIKTYLQKPKCSVKWKSLRAKFGWIWEMLNKSINRMPTYFVWLVRNDWCALTLSRRTLLLNKLGYFYCITDHSLHRVAIPLCIYCDLTKHIMNKHNTFSISKTAVIIAMLISEKTK